MKTLKRCAVAAVAVLTMVTAGGLVAAGEASASPQILTKSGPYRTQNCLTMVGIVRLTSGKAAWCDSKGLPNGYAWFWHDL